MLNRQRSLAVRLVEACDNLSPDEKWEELERSDSEVIFVRSKGVYTIRSKDQSVEQISELFLIWKWPVPKNQGANLLRT